MSEHFISEFEQQDRDFENRLRPTSFADFVGQQKVRERLELFTEAARQRNDVLDHVLLYGPPGVGKTTLAFILAESMGVNIRCTSGPVIDKPGDLAGLLTNLERGDILLYSAMEDFVIDIMIDQGPNSRSIRLDVAPFTLVGATTRSGLLTAPLRSRFGLTNRLDYYTHDELSSIVNRSAGIIGVEVEPAGAREVASRSRGTARIANNLLRRVRDYAQVKADNRVTRTVADQALAMLDIDDDGLDEMDKRILLTMIEKFNGGPVGISSLAVSVGEESGTLEEVYEPYLIREGFMKRTAQGRVVTQRAYDKFGLPHHASQKTLF